MTSWVTFFLILSSGATLASCQSFFLTGSVHLQTYLAAVQSCSAPAVGSFNLWTVPLVTYSCAPNSFSPSCYSFTHSSAALVAFSLKGKSVSFRGSSVLFAQRRVPHSPLGPASGVPCSMFSSITPTPSVVAPLL